MKFIATIATTIALLFGGTIALAPPASADDCGTPIQCLNEGGSETSPLIALPATTTVSAQYARQLEARVQALEARVLVAETTANDYRVTIAQQAALIEELRAQVAQQAAAIQRQRATIQRLRARLSR